MDVCVSLLLQFLLYQAHNQYAIFIERNQHTYTSTSDNAITYKRICVKESGNEGDQAQKHNATAETFHIDDVAVLGFADKDIVANEQDAIRNNVDPGKNLDSIEGKQNDFGNDADTGNNSGTNSCSNNTFFIRQNNGEYRSNGLNGNRSHHTW